MKHDAKIVGGAATPFADDTGLGLSPLPAAWHARPLPPRAATADQPTTPPEGITS
ncbi:hypothetical protein [Streptomyces sp. NBC_01187]|uniref:hypothetical protein n=1 Tax=Streptomyces sp. NBC_01187 TaxID=2903766 RepID=UPI00386422F5|nr:hypothetical protein OG220_11760 [Streptomyces sp. NBC_01187]